MTGQNRNDTNDRRDQDNKDDTKDRTRYRIDSTKQDNEGRLATATCLNQRSARECAEIDERKLQKDERNGQGYAGGSYRDEEVVPPSSYKAKPISLYAEAVHVDASEFNKLTPSLSLGLNIATSIKGKG
jgi:hypothetical protein